MSEQIGLGIFLVLLGGAVNGSFASPMKHMPNWRWENTWLIYVVTGLIIIPWALAAATIPHLGMVYQQSSWSVLAKIALYGFAWGIGALLLGQGIARVGLAIGFAVILGITSSLGSLLPLAVLHPEQLHTNRGLALLAGTLVMIVGLVFLSIAGGRREREQNPVQATSGRSGFGTGLIICVFSGIFSSMLNFAFIFGDEVKQHALDAGASSAMAGNAIWALAVTSGFVANAIYCVYLLNKNHTWGIFKGKDVGLGYWLGGALMGALWFGGLVAYGMGAAALGVLGGMIGWPVFMSMDIIAGISWGFINREWKGASRASYGYCLSGIGILFLAIAIIALGNAT
jgi:L-rhamnose-H+ transport protein